MAEPPALTAGRDPVKLVGDFYTGTLGPTILLVAQSSVECSWLQNIFQDLARNAGHRRRLSAESGVELANIDGLDMVSRSGGPYLSLRRLDDAPGTSFVWSGIPEGWQYLVELVQPLCDGGRGHHYLADDPDDAALIELSVGEKEVLDAATEHR